MNKNSPANPDIGIRMLRAVKLLLDGQALTSRALMDLFDTSWATAKRDINMIGMYLPVKITKVGRFKTVKLPLRDLPWRTR